MERGDSISKWRVRAERRPEKENASVLRKGMGKDGSGIVLAELVEADSGGVQLVASSELRGLCVGKAVSSRAAPGEPLPVDQSISRSRATLSKQALSFSSIRCYLSRYCFWPDVDKAYPMDSSWVVAKIWNFDSDRASRSKVWPPETELPIESDTIRRPFWDLMEKGIT